MEELKSPLQVSTPPDFPSLKNEYGIFLGGSIEMGKAVDWQQQFIKDFSKKNQYRKNDKHVSYVFNRNFRILNPRRSDWDSSWVQSIKDPQFFQQVTWELEYLEKAWARVFYFAGDTLSPISLLELGKFGAHPNTFILWDKDYKRAGNLEIFCHRYNLEVAPDMDSIITKLSFL